MGASSGLIIAFVVAVWAAYFVPLALRRYDDAGRNATVEEAGSAGRVIAPRATEPEPEQVASPAPSAPSAPVALDRPAARLAARRRRRTLLTLIALLVVTSGVALAGVAPKLIIAVPAVLIVAWLVACRIQVRGELGLSKPRAPRSTSTAVADDEEETIVVSGQVEDVDPGREHVMEDEPLTVDALDDQVVIAVPSVTNSGEAVWDPLPITVPTYVTKPRAGRTVRTIDFNQPGTWTSGHVEGEDTELPQRKPETPDERQAVNG